jgi:hypothetical protein
LADLLARFVIARNESVPLEQALEEAAHVEPLLILKKGGLEEPEPDRWTEDLIRRLLLDVVPRHQMQPRELYLAQIPALGEYFTFLASCGRWSAENLDLDSAQALLRDLVLPVLETVEDPSRPSEPEIILAYARSQGIDPGDPQTFAQFLAWFNGELTREERRGIATTGRFP